MLAFKDNLSQNNICLSNDGRQVFVEYNQQTFSYLGPKNLVRFVGINDFNNGVLSVQTIFKNADGEEYSEEDYIDLMDLDSECEVPALQ